MAIRTRFWIVFIAVVLTLQQLVRAEDLPTVERASFPKNFVFGAATAAYQV